MCLGCVAEDARTGQAEVIANATLKDARLTREPSSLLMRAGRASWHLGLRDLNKRRQAVMLPRFLCHTCTSYDSVMEAEGVKCGSRSHRKFREFFVSNSHLIQCDCDSP